MLKHGQKYWLGATYGTYDNDSHTFKTGNCFVPVGKTWFAKSRSDRKNPKDYEAKTMYNPCLCPPCVNPR